MTAEQLIEHVDKLRKEKNYKEIIPLLNDSILEELDNATLYAHRAEAHALLNEPDQAIFYANKSIKINSKLPLSYLSNGIAWNVKKEYNKAIDNLNKAIALDEKYVAAYNIRGNAFLLKKEYDKALDDYNKAIQLNNKYAFAYCNRGIVWNNKNEFDKAIDDSTNAIELDDKFANAYVNRGVAWVGKKEYDKAIDDYNKAISLDNKYNLTYHNRGVAWAAKKEYNKAIDDYDKAISLDDDYANTFFNRGIAYNELGNYVKAIKDYRKYIELTNAFDYRNQVAKSRIEDLQKKLNDIWYKDVSDVIDKIKNFLLFRDLHLTHYTSLSGAKSMILDKSEFRLSEGAYLNDTSEGQELFRYLNYSTVKQINDETVAEVFVERPFIGSFVIDSKHDDLTLWRTYGKEGGAEAKGCALTINKERFISTLKDRTIGVEDKSISVLQLENQFTFYKVVYIRKEEKNRFIIPGQNKVDEDSLNKLMKTLQEIISELSQEQQMSIKEQLNGIAYLFKSSDYQYEQEIRFVVQGVGFIKKIRSDETPPKVFIELTNIIPALCKLTLGPKVERAEEWAAAFNYYIKNYYVENVITDSKVEIVISHLPFK